MAKKKPADQHKSKYMVRLPEPYRPALVKLKAKTRRATTVDVQMAIDKHLTSEGITPPAPSS